MLTKLVLIIALFTTSLFSFEVYMYDNDQVNNNIILDFNTDWDNVGGDEGTNWVAIYKAGDSNDWDNVITWAWAKDLAHDERPAPDGNYDYRVFPKVMDDGVYEVRFFLNNSYDVFASKTYINCTKEVDTVEKLKDAAEGINVNAGDIVCVLPREYNYSIDEIDFNVSGKENNHITFIAKGDVKLKAAVNGENGSNLYISGSWLTFKDFEISGFQNGVHITKRDDKTAPSHNIIDNINSHDNWFSAISIEGSFEDNATGYNDQDHSGSSVPRDNLIKNCLAHDSKGGEHGDGINIRAGVGVGNVIENCKAYDNDDDGFDLWQAGEKVVIKNSIAHDNGKGVHGSGFKLGEAVRDRDKNGNLKAEGEWADEKHELISCKAENNTGYGFTYSEALVGRKLTDCNATNNDYGNFDFGAVLDVSTFINCYSNGNHYNP